MNLSKKKFNENLNKGSLVISLIGMSNIGKTYWAKKLTTLNFKHIDCDALIERKLAPELKASGHKGIQRVDSWVGQPYEKYSSLNQKKYLESESKVMREILKDLKNRKEKNIVIDTTGSFVYTNKVICNNLRKNSLIVYLETTDDTENQMFREYLRESKPVIWKNHYKPQKGETREEALKRCYLKLLKERKVLYGRYADVTIPPPKTFNKDMDVQDFISLIEESL